MNIILEQHKDELNALCRRYHVAELDVFGSAGRWTWSSRKACGTPISFRPSTGHGGVCMSLREPQKYLYDIINGLDQSRELLQSL